MSNSAAAQYKKQDGFISVSADGQIVSWKSTAGAGALSIATADIGNLQQTPATSAKASIKVVAIETSPQAGNHTFTFTSAAARDDQQAITGLLRKWIEAAKSQNVLPVAPAGVGGGGASAAMAMAQTVTAGAHVKEDAYDDTKLLADWELQKSLLSASPALRQRFDRALQEKPESVSISQFSNQFWTTRVHMLRSHATERSQSTGTYNVLSVVKTKLVNGSMTLNLTKEQIQLIFKQHTVVHKAYNENVPPMKEAEFWERFMNSALMKKLKGERIAENHPKDPKLDQYKDYDENADDAQQLVVSSIPNFINIEANEQNHSQKKGNQSDFTMRPANHEKAPILRVLNRMSEKMMKEVPFSDAGRHGPAGMDEETYKELRLQDLQRAADDNRVVLKVQDQSTFFSAGQSLQNSSSAAAYTKRTPAQVLSILRKDFGGISANRSNVGGVNLQPTIGINDDSDSEEENVVQQTNRVGNKPSRTAATSQILSAINKRHLHDDDDYSLHKSLPTSDQAIKLGISESTLDNLTMTHNTTVEFLHYFWAVFYSGDPERANEAAKLIETLDRSLDRIKAVANAAESERTATVEKIQRENDAFTKHTGKRKKFDPDSIKGGAIAVNQIVEPLFRAIDTARSQYQAALQEQLNQSGLSN